jgi:hypothetical protein
MSRRVIALAIVLGATPASAQEPEDTYDEPLPDVGEDPGDTVGDRELGVALGAAVGGGDLTPGGLRIAGNYLYQMSDLDWFEGSVAFVFGAGGAECFRDRADELVCDHASTDGVATDGVAGVRRFFAGQGAFRPWLRAAVGLRIVRFGDDEITGAGLYLAPSAGVRARVDDRIAIGGHATFELGGAWFSRGYGPAPQLGFGVGMSVEFALE